MSIRQSVLALLAQGPRYGARLKSEFEARTGGTWPLNVGQVYTTLARLERDGLVTGDGRPDDEGRIAYRLTERGRSQAAAWWITPVERGEAARDEVVIKLALAVSTPGVDPYAVLRTQRTATMRTLQRLTRAKLALAAADGSDPAAPERLVLEHGLYAVEAELRWLDQVEAMLAARPDPPRASQPTSPPASGSPTSRTSSATTTGTQP